MRWLSLDRARRRRVALAVRKGEAVGDPREAPYAVAFADSTLDWLSWKRRFRPLHLMLVALVLAELTLTGGWHPALVLYPLLGFAYLRLRAPRLRARARAAREANAELAERMKLPAVSVEMPARAIFHRGSRVRRQFTIWATLVLVGLVALAVVATVYAQRESRRWTAAADRACARERVRIAALPVRRLGPIETQKRTYRIEQDALAALERMKARSPLQKNFVAWREYEVKLDSWVLEQLELGNDLGVAVGAERIRSARRYSRKLARRLGANVCARV